MTIDVNGITPPVMCDILIGNRLTPHIMSEILL